MLTSMSTVMSHVNRYLNVAAAAFMEKLTFKSLTLTAPKFIPYICMYCGTETLGESERETEAERDRERERVKERERKRERERERER